MSSLNMEFVQALNPLYAFPIVAVILCAFLVYALGFKTPVQPPSFDEIEEKKVVKKRKTKDASKGKVVQNGKVNGTANKVQAPANKKKETEKNVAEKPVANKPVAEKKTARKQKAQTEKKAAAEKKEDISLEDMSDDGWVQLVSRKGRKNRKKDEASAENQTVPAKSAKTSEINKSDESSVSEESPMKDNKDIKEVIASETEITSKLSKEKKPEDKTSTDKSNKMVADVASKSDDNFEKELPKETVSKTSKCTEEGINKPKKKKKKNEVVETAVPPANCEMNTMELTPAAAKSKEDAYIIDVAEVSSVEDGKVLETETKDSKSTNVAFDELAGLYPEPKEQKKKKKVRRDH